MKKIIAWAMYDWANSAFALIIMAGFFPILLKSYWSDAMSVNESSFWLGVGNAVAALLIALVSPVVGAMADRQNGKKRMLAFFTFLGVVMTAALYFVAKGQWQMGVMVYIIATIGHACTKPFYNALLLNVSPSDRLAPVSTFGYAMGYVGGGVLFALIAWASLKPETFGLSGKLEAVRLAFIAVACWWGVFTLPIMLFVDEHDKTHPSGTSRTRGVWQELRHQFNRIRKVRALWLFLAAYWFYIGAVGTISRMGVDYGLSLGFSSGNMITALLISQVVAFPAALLFGFLGGRFKERACILVSIAVYAAVCYALYRVETITEFYILAGLIGSVLGGVQALSRSLYAALIPEEESAGLFGFYNTVTRFSLILGPAVMGLASIVSGDTRVSMLPVVVMLVVGGMMLSWVRENMAQPQEAEVK